MSEQTRVLPERFDDPNPATMPARPDSPTDLDNPTDLERGPDADGGIRTLPPLEHLQRGVPVDPRTGEPRRPRLLLASMALLLAASLVAAIAFVKAWWDTIHVQNWPRSIHLMQWTNTRPGSWQSITLAVLFGLIGLVMVAGPAICAHNAWAGQRWTRVAALVAAALECLALLMNPLSWLALPLALAGAVLLWLAPVGAFFDQWRRFGAEPQPEFPEPGPVQYGPLPRYR